MFSNFQSLKIKTSDAEIKLVKGGQGFPILLLHGYPQTHIMWHKIAPMLAENFTVIATDLRGYGDSSKPPGNQDHSNYSKRVTAQDQVEVMAQLGYEQFYLIGHDRGARVAQRLSLDYPQKVKKLGVLDIVPTYQMYTTTDQQFATAYYHWFFLIQPFPFPETLISQNPDYFLRHCLRTWSQNFDSFTEEALREYIRCFDDPKTIHGTCEDYRASATIDLEHDLQDITCKIQCPLLVLWGKNGFIQQNYNCLKSWQKRGVKVMGNYVNCGHFLPEEAPEETYNNIKEFLNES
ncbi:MAG TPA: alpha/beta hydrolase [Cyanothece sp. UBA12306]|nr:alpha/beta hydrolase [Cyanothece sp. UBA12306]